MSSSIPSPGWCRSTKSKQARTTRTWSNLPSDILSKIYGRLNFIDEISCRGVCTNWKAVPGCHMPLLLTYAGQTLDIYSHDNQTKTFRPAGPNYLFRTGGGKIDLLAANSGWLLLHNNFTSQLFFFNPFYDMRVIRLPMMADPVSKWTSRRAAFSAKPNCSNCVVFVIDSYRNKIVITTCARTNNGTTNLWGLSTDEHSFFDNSGVKDVTYSPKERKFYCVFRGGLLGAFDVVSREWKILTGSELLPAAVKTEHEYYLVVRGGEEVLLVCFGSGFLVFKFDPESGWVKQDKLGKVGIFVGGGSSCCVPAGEERSNLAERIYYHGDSYCWYYSFEKGHRELTVSQKSREYDVSSLEKGAKKAWIQF